MKRPPIPHMTMIFHWKWYIPVVLSVPDNISRISLIVIELSSLEKVSKYESRDTEDKN
jgi:hypothetical protein